MKILTPADLSHQNITSATEAVALLQKLYDEAANFLNNHFNTAMVQGAPRERIRAFYPEVRIVTTSYAQVDTRLSFGHVSNPGTYTTTVTRPKL